MAKRFNFTRATEDRKMRTKGSERLEAPALAEHSRHEYRKVMNERSEDPELLRTAASHQTIAEQARADFETREGGVWRLVRGSKKLKERVGKKLRMNKRVAKKAKR